MQPKKSYFQCPKQSYSISEAMCLARQSANFDKCARCPHRQLHLDPDVK